jgi:hypothetical protein
MDISTLEEETITLRRNVGHQPSSDAALHLRKTESQPNRCEILKNGQIYALLAELIELFVTLN